MLSLWNIPTFYVPRSFFPFSDPTQPQGRKKKKTTCPTKKKTEIVEKKTPTTPFFYPSAYSLVFWVPRSRPVRRAAITRRGTYQRESHLVICLGILTTSLLTLGSVTRDSRGLSDMLMVTTSVGMVDGIHSHTTSPWPAVPLDHVLVHSAGRLK